MAASKALNNVFKLHDLVHVGEPRFGSARPGSSAAVNTPAIQAALTHILNEGGKLVFEPRGVYAVNAALDFRISTGQAQNYYRSIDFQGATLDFSDSGITAGGLFQYGADTLGLASEVSWSDIENLTIIGPENATNIIPRYTSNSTDAVSTTTTVGMSASFALQINLKNIYVRRCYKGFLFTGCFRNLIENIKAKQCIIGHHIDATCTYMTFIKPEAELCTFPYLLRPDTVSSAITTITFLSPQAENSTTFMHIDNNAASGTEIQNISVINPYLENIFDDHVRVGIAFDSTPANYSTRGADRAGKLGPVVFDSGRAAGSGNGGSGWGANRAAFVFATTPNVMGGRILFPCTLANIVNIPPHISFQSVIRAEDVTTQIVDCIVPGYGIVHVSAAGAIVFSKGNIASTANAGTGLYNVTLTKAYGTADKMAIQVTAREASLYAAVDDANTTASVIRVQLRSDAGVLTDGKFTLIVNGELAVL